MSDHRIGVLVMSYGTPENMEQVEAYYTHIRRGNPPSQEQLQELKDRYEAIGGLFPLRENTNRQVQALEKKLNETNTEYQFSCYQGLKHAYPFIEDGIAEMAKDGIKRAVGIVLAPHYSVMSVGGYIKRAQAKADELGIAIDFVKSYHNHPKLIEVWSNHVEDALKRFHGVDQSEINVIFTAHSLPEKILEMNDPYADQLMETSKAVAERTGLKRWRFAWQSAGQTPDPWLGPDILDVLKTIREEEQAKYVLICPVGFVSDHLEILYDIDIACQELAHELGIDLKRTESLNTDPIYIETLADVVLAQLERK